MDGGLMELLGWLFLLLVGGYAVFNMSMVGCMIAFHKEGLGAIVPSLVLSIIATIIYGLVILWLSPVNLSLSW